MCSGSYFLKRALNPVWEMVEKGRGRSREDSWETVEVFHVRDNGGFDWRRESENGRIICKEKPIGFTDGIDVEG